MKLKSRIRQWFLVSFIIYPEVRGVGAKFDGAHSLIDQVVLEVAPIEKLVGFYRMGFSLPVLKFNRQS